MKKMTTTVTENGKTKTISVWLDERTVQALEQVNDEEFTRQYIIDEHKSKLADYRETRRHRSLDADIENGFDAPDEHCMEDDIFESIEVEHLQAALMGLTPEQQNLIHRVYFCGESQKDIAEEMGLDKTSIRDRLRTIYKKILKNFEE